MIKRGLSGFFEETHWRLSATSKSLNKKLVQPVQVFWNGFMWRCILPQSARISGKLKGCK